MKINMLKIMIRPWSWKIILLSLILSCQKTDNFINTIDSNQIETLKSQFLADSKLLIDSNVYKKFTFRQSLERVILWDSLIVEESFYYFPVKYKLPENMRSTNGSRLLDLTAYLRISKIENDSENKYSLLTYFSDSSTLNKFSGEIFYEDYFSGTVKFSSYLDGKWVDKEVYNKQIHVSKKVGKSLRAGSAPGSPDNCAWKKVGDVCVSWPGIVGEICGSTYEYQCSGGYVDDGINPNLGGGDESLDKGREPGSGNNKPTKDEIGKLQLNKGVKGCNFYFKKADGSDWQAARLTGYPITLVPGSLNEPPRTIYIDIEIGMPMYSPVLKERLTFGDAARFSAESFNKALARANSEYRAGRLHEFNIPRRVVVLTGQYLKEALGPSASTASSMNTNPGAGEMKYDPNCI